MVTMQPMKDFIAGDSVYTHCFNPKDDSTYVILECSTSVVYKVDSSARAFDREGKQTGQFFTNAKSQWCYQPISGNLIPTEHANLLLAERQVFKQLLEQSCG